MVKTTYGLPGKDIGVSDKTCGLKIISTPTLIECLNKGTIVIPDFQRELQQDKIEGIVSEFIKRHKNNENYLIKHGFTISLCKLGNKKELYVIDGQHRLEAIKILCKDGYQPDVIVRIQLCSDIEQMQYDFKLLNSNIPLIYTCFENDFISNTLFDLKNKLKLHYPLSFNRSKKDVSNSNRLHLDCFINLFDIELIKKMDGKINSEILFEKLENLNSEIMNIFLKLDTNQHHFYINSNDNKVIEKNKYFLSLKNIYWINKFFDKNSEITLNPIKYKKSKIPKSLSKKIYDRDIGQRDYVGKCFVCQNEITRDNAHIGHIVPEYLGGDTNFDNLKAICSCCNLSMGTRNLFEYKEKYFNKL